jgi:membrane-associated phospholipid phosphatase
MSTTRGVCRWTQVSFAAAITLAGAVQARSASLDDICSSRTQGFTDDVKCYFTAPVRWDGRDWVYFGSAVAMVGLAHHYDDDVRNHFVGDTATSPATADSHDVDDALPAAGVLAATWVYAMATRDRDGRSESWQMLEAAGLSTATSYLLRYAAGRERPDVTSDPDQWRTGGNSFPSNHTTVAFAIGTVLAESGNDRYRWLRRFLGYGMAAYTGYARLEHNAHWLSDTVAGAALGMSTAQFVLNRHDAPARVGQLTWVPLDRGVMLTYNLTLP